MKKVLGHLAIIHCCEFSYLPKGHTGLGAGVSIKRVSDGLNSTKLAEAQWACQQKLKWNCF